MIDSLGTVSSIEYRHVYRVNTYNVCILHFIILYTFMTQIRVIHFVNTFGVNLISVKNFDIEPLLTDFVGG